MLSTFVGNTCKRVSACEVRDIFPPPCCHYQGPPQCLPFNTSDVLLSVIQCRAQFPFPVQKENMSSEVEWSKDIVINRIELFREKTVLWDQTCAQFKDRNCKNNTWVIIAHEMQVSKTEVQNKMKILIGQYQRESKKGTSFSGVDSAKSKWFACESLRFLKDKPAPRRTQEAGEEHDIELSEHSLNP
ncbi:hypothetical protein PR048_016447 [Dryococelus australis]|uniref:MADF domain-containing protein n=1 Tax=Dryococelus australis TaxID=614101 RepID=A0ABQ9HK68_9NEOP|nr:hypothetical protein PR048_016447 [Dryococelus australis]